MRDLFGYRNCVGLLIVIALLSACSKPLGRGEIQGRKLPDSVLEDKESRQESVTDTESSQILFGDLHVKGLVLSDWNYSVGASAITPATAIIEPIPQTIVWPLQINAPGLRLFL